MESPTAAPPPPNAHRRIARRRHLRLALVRCLIGALPPFAFNRSRLLALRACGVRTGSATLFWGMPRLSGSGSFVSRLQIGSNCGFNEGCEFELDAPITIGNHVSVGHEVRFLTGTVPDGRAFPAPIRIGDGSWLGARSVVLGGVTVGAGSVIGAGITVTADVPPNTLLTGARPVSLAKWR